jgi:PAS domain S-box-containing protein
MKDQNKTKKQLLNELMELRQGVAELEMVVKEHKCAEEALRESEERYRSLFEGSRDAIYTNSREGKILDANQSMLDLFGYSREEMIGLKARETYVHPEDRLKFQQKIEREGFVRDYEIKLRKKDGTELECLFTSIVRRSADGNIVGYQGIIRDITERKQAEEKVKQASEEWELTFNSIKDLVSIHDKDFRIVKVNKAFADTFGMENGELIGKKCYEIIHGTEEPWPNCPHRQTLGCGKPVTEEFWEPRRGRYLEVSASPIYNEKAEMIGTIHITKDITERKGAEEVLRASEERYRSYIEVTGQLGWTTNADGEVLEDIPAWRKFTGQGEEEVKGMGWSKALHPDDVEHTMQLWNKAVTTKSAYKVEYRIRKYDGVYRHFLTRSVPVFKKDGSIHEWVGTCIDITDRKRAEEALKESELKYRTLIESSTDAILLLDVERNIVTCNQAFLNLFGYQKGEIEGRSIRIIHPSDESFHSFGKTAYPVIARSGFFRTEWGFTHKDGIIFPAETVTSAIKLPDGSITGYIAIIRDITERKGAEEEREKLIHELQEALANIKTLRGLLPICSHCKKIRDDKGYWNQIESYIRDHSGAEFTHGMCPECMKKLYPDLVD